MATPDARYALPGRITQTQRRMGVQRQLMSASVRSGRCYPTDVVRAKDLCRRPQWLFIAAVAAVVAAVAMWVLVQGHAVVRSESPASHPAHVSVSSHSGKPTIDSDHAHLGHPSSGGHHEALLAAVVPNSPAPTVAALCVMVAVAAVGVFWRHATLAGRSPPRGLAAVVTGQDLLTRLCLSRR